MSAGNVLRTGDYRLSADGDGVYQSRRASLNVLQLVLQCKRVPYSDGTVRVLGNASVHSYPLGKAPESAPDRTDVEITLLMLLQLIEWYLLEYRATGARR
jgi:hypothetical protein